ncbi:MAG TPA: hypothetical protein VGG07_20850 [Solirubrobacteraceae bacterium]
MTGWWKGGVDDRLGAEVGVLCSTVSTLRAPAGRAIGPSYG